MPDLNTLLGGEYHFAETSDEESFHQKDLIQLLPFGISVAADLKNTFFFLKDKTQSKTLPVLVNPIEASLILAQMNATPEVQLAQPHFAVTKLLETLGVALLQCVFVQTKGNRQFVRLYFNGHPGSNSIKLNADQAMSLCMALKVPIYATAKFINQSKVVQVQIEGLTKKLAENQKLLLKNATYLQ